MNIKIKIPIAIVVLSIYFLGINVQNASAVCCVGNGACSQPGSNGLCSDGAQPSSDEVCKQWCGSGSGRSGSPSGGSSTGAGSGGNTNINFQNPIGASTLMQVLTNLLNSLKSVVIIIAVIFIIIGGLMYMMSGGNEKTITRAKACVSGAVIGLAIVLAAPIFLNEVLRIFGGATSVPTQGMTSSMTIAAVASNVLNFLLSILGIIAIISLVVGGGMYLTAYGDEKRIETGKKTIKYAVLGIVIALSSILIVREVGNLLGESTTSGYPSNMSNPSIPGLGTGTGMGVNPINIPINIPRN